MKMKFRCAFSVLLMLIGSGILLATGCITLLDAPSKSRNNETVVWEDVYSAHNIESEIPRFLAIGDHGSIYIIGTGKAAGDYADLLILKYDAEGKLLWEVAGLTDPDCMLRPTGFYLSNDALYISGEYVCGDPTDIQNASFAIISFSSDGEQLAIIADDAHAQPTEPSSLDMDEKGNLYAAFSASEYSEALDAEKCVLIKFNAAGETLWRKRYDPDENGANSGCPQMVLDGEGGVFIAGWAQNIAEVADSENGDTWIPPDGSGETADDFIWKDAMLAKYDSTGELIWSEHWDRENLNDQIIRSMTLDDDGDVYIAATTGVKFGQTDIMLAKYDTDSNLVWADVFGGAMQAADAPGPLVTDGNGNLLLAACMVEDNPAGDMATMAYTTDGLLLWSDAYSDTEQSFDYPRAIAVDDEGYIYTVGISCEEYATDSAYDDQLYGCEFFNWSNLTSAGCEQGAYQIVTLKYDPEGVLQWTRTYEKEGPLDFAGMTLGRDEDLETMIYVTGAVGQDLSSDIAIINYDDEETSIMSDSDSDPLACGGCDGFM